VLSTGLEGKVLTAAEANDRAVTAGRIVERMWDWMTALDPELQSVPEGPVRGV
jgi:hypothetical protein